MSQGPLVFYQRPTDSYTTAITDDAIVVETWPVLGATFANHVWCGHETLKSRYQFTYFDEWQQMPLERCAFGVNTTTFEEERKKHLNMILYRLPSTLVQLILVYSMPWSFLQPSFYFKVELLEFGSWFSNDRDLAEKREIDELFSFSIDLVAEQNAARQKLIAAGPHLLKCGPFSSEIDNCYRQLVDRERNCMQWSYFVDIFYEKLLREIRLWPQKHLKLLGEWLRRCV